MFDNTSIAEIRLSDGALVIGSICLETPCCACSGSGSVVVKRLVSYDQYDYCKLCSGSGRIITADGQKLLNFLSANASRAASDS